MAALSPITFTNQVEHQRAIARTFTNEVATQSAFLAAVTVPMESDLLRLRVLERGVGEIEARIAEVQTDDAPLGPIRRAIGVFQRQVAVVNEQSDPPPQSWHERCEAALQDFDTLIAKENAHHDRTFPKMIEIFLNANRPDNRTDLPQEDEEVEEAFNFYMNAQAARDKVLAHLSEEVTQASELLGRAAEYVEGYETRIRVLTEDLKERKRRLEIDFLALEAKLMILRSKPNPPLAYERQEKEVLLSRCEFMNALSEARKASHLENEKIHQIYQIFQKGIQVACGAVEQRRALEELAIKDLKQHPIAVMLIQGIYSRNTRFFTLYKELLTQVDAAFTIQQRRDLYQAQMDGIHEQIADTQELIQERDAWNAALHTPGLTTIVPWSFTSEMEVFSLISESWSDIFSKERLENRLTQLSRMHIIFQRFSTLREQERQLFSQYIGMEL